MAATPGDARLPGPPIRQRIAIAFAGRIAATRRRRATPRVRRFDRPPRAYFRSMKRIRQSVVPVFSNVCAGVAGLTFTVPCATSPSAWTLPSGA